MPGNFAALVSVQLKLLVAALRCDVTRVVTLQLGDAMGSGISFPFAGAGGGDWDALAHTPVAGGADPKAVIDTWCMSQLAQLLSMMKTIPRAEGPCSISAAVLWATNMEDGATHDAQKLPWILAGTCGGASRPARWLTRPGKPLDGVSPRLPAPWACRSRTWATRRTGRHSRPQGLSWSPEDWVGPGELRSPEPHA